MVTLTATTLRAMLHRGEVSVTELVTDALQRAEANAELGAFISLEAELALHEAQILDRTLIATPHDERHTLPPLFGLPTAHKDLVQVEGFITTHGSRAVPQLRARHDDPVAARIRAAGGICIGKTQVPEFGIAAYSENLLAPPARNPYDTARTAGGSSGGTATAIAAGVIPAAIGSDAGGSIRIPAAACGLIGLKPGRGVVPIDRRSGPLERLGAPTLAVSGPMAHTTRDAALYFDALAGTHTTTALERAEELRGLRIGMSFTSPFQAQWAIRFDAAARNVVERAARLLEERHTVEQTQMHYERGYPAAFTDVWTQALSYLAPLDEAALGKLAGAFLQHARGVSQQQLSQQIAALASFTQGAITQWNRYDFVLTPTLAFAPPAIGAFWAEDPAHDYRLQCEWAPQTSMVNVTGWAAISVPLGSDQAGLPRGVQLIGRPGSETQLLQLAAQLELAYKTT